MSGTNLLTVAANGAIIGVQQTVGYLNNHTSAYINTQKKSTRKPEPKKSTVMSASSVSPNEAQKVPAKYPALPQATTTVTSAQENRQPVKPASTSSSPMMPKINAVFTLADSGITSDTLNKHTKDETKEPRVPTPDELTVKTRSVVPLETSKEKLDSLNQGAAASGAPKFRIVEASISSSKALPKLVTTAEATGAPKFQVVEASISSTKTLQKQLTTKNFSSVSLKSLDSIVSGLAASKSHQCSVPQASHKTTQIVPKPASAASKLSQTTNASHVATNSVKILEKGIAPSSMSQCPTTNVSLVRPDSVGEYLQCPTAEIAATTKETSPKTNVGEQPSTTEIAHKSTEQIATTKEITLKTNADDQQSASNILKQFIRKQAQDSLVDSFKMTSAKNLINQSIDVSCDSRKEVSSIDSSSYVIKETPLIASPTKVLHIDSPAKVPTIDSPTKVPPIDSLSKVPPIVLEKQSKQLLSDLTKVLTKNVHNVLADVQNKVISKNKELQAKHIANKEKPIANNEKPIPRGIKRKADDMELQADSDVHSRGIKRKADGVVMLADASVQNKLSVTRECETNVDLSQPGGMKRQADDSAVSHDSEKRKIAANSTPYDASQSNPLKVKFTWNKRWTVEARDEIVQASPGFVISKLVETAKLEPPSTPSAPVVGDSCLNSQPHTPIKENPIPNKDGLIPKKENKKTVSISNSSARYLDKPEAQPHIPNKDKVTPNKDKLTPNNDKVTQSKDKLIPNKEEQVRLNSPDGPLIINDPQGYEFTHNLKTKTISINGRVALLKPIKKLTAEGAKRLGCSHSGSCPLLKNLPSDNKKTKKATYQPEQASRLAALTKNPDFGHIASGDRVAYLKELLRMQRAALGLSD